MRGNKGEGKMGTATMLLPARYEDAKEALHEKLSWFIIRPFVLQVLIRKAITPSNLYLKNLEKELPYMQDISKLKSEKEFIDSIVGLQNEFFEGFKNENIITKKILASTILESEELRDRFENFSEDIELAMDSTFKKCVKHAVSALPSEVRSKAEKELDEWLQYS